MVSSFSGMGHHSYFTLIYVATGTMFICFFRIVVYLLNKGALNLDWFYNLHRLAIRKYTALNVPLNVHFTQMCIKFFSRKIRLSDKGKTRNFVNGAS